MNNDKGDKLARSIGTDHLIGRICAFIRGVWDIFKGSKDGQQVREALTQLKALPVDRQNPEAFSKAVRFLEVHSNR